MKIMVCLKQVPHQDARLDIAADGTWIQEDNIKFEINSYDTYAVEEALRLKDAGDAEVVVVSIGPDRVTQALRTALGMGADRAIHVNDPAAFEADVDGAQVRYRGDGFDVRFVEGEPESLQGDATGEVDLTYYRIMERVARAVLSSSRATYVGP